MLVGARKRIRTFTVPGLSRLPLPLGYACKWCAREELNLRIQVSDTRRQFRWRAHKWRPHSGSNRASAGLEDPPASQRCGRNGAPTRIRTAHQSFVDSGPDPLVRAIFRNLLLSRRHLTAAPAGPGTETAPETHRRIVLPSTSSASARRVCQPQFFPPLSSMPMAMNSSRDIIYILLRVELG